MNQKNKIIISTTPSLDGYHITEYMDVISCETIYKLSLGKAFSGVIDDIVDSWRIFSNNELSGTANLIREATEYVKDQLIQKASSMGADAVVGVDIETSIAGGSEAAKVSINGTAVKIEPIAVPTQGPKKRYPVALTNSGLPFRVSAVYATHISSDEHSLALEVFHAADCSLRALIADVVFCDILGNEVYLESIVFSGFEAEKEKYLVSSLVMRSISPDTLDLLSSVKVVVKKYIVNDELIALDDVSVSEALQEPEPEQGSPESLSIEILSVAENFERAKEISDYIKAYNDEHNGVIDQELTDKLDHIVMMEKFYGNHRNEAVKALREYFGMAE